MVYKVTDLIKQKFTVSAELVPPRNGAYLNDILTEIDRLAVAGADFLSVTMGAGGSLRGGSLPIAHMIQNKAKLSALAHFVCRDFTPERIENHLVDHNYFGILNILALRGDPPCGLEEDYLPAPGSYPYAYQLVEQITRIKEGKYLRRKGYDKDDSEYVGGAKVDFCIGVAAYPQYNDINLGVQYLKRKVEAGAEFAVTQMIFHTDDLLRFRDLCWQRGVRIPILPGFRSLRSLKMCARLEKMFMIKIPDEIKKTLEGKTKAEGTELGKDISLKLMETWKNEGFQGVHLFVMEDSQTAARLIKEA